jgi:hypothetical protein
MKRGVVTAILLSLLAWLSAAEADPRLFEAPGYSGVHLPSPTVEQAPGPYLAQGYGDGRRAGRKAQGGGRQIIPPSVALRTALGYSPGSQGLGVRLLKDGRLMYAVKLKTGNRVHRVLVDAQTGQVVGD